MTTLSTTAPRPSAGRLFLGLGLLLTVLGIVGYIVQLSMGRLFTPWYVPISATVGLVCVFLALGKRRTVWRWLALVLVVLFAGAEWAIMFGAQLPAYTGPIAVGKPMPVFTTVRADGTPLTQRDLVGEKNNAMVFSAAAGDRSAGSSWVSSNADMKISLAAKCV
jgi:hypothetical protein